jgi:hypothetical protein
MPPGVIAATLWHGRKARRRLECIGGGIAFPRFPEGDEESGAKTAPAPGRAANQGKS